MFKNTNLSVKSSNDLGTLFETAVNSKNFLVTTEEIDLMNVSIVDGKLDYYQVLIVLNGSFEIHINDQTIHLVQHSIVLLTPYTIIKTKSVSGKVRLRKICVTESFICNTPFNIGTLQLFDFFLTNSGTALKLKNCQFETLEKMYSIIEAELQGDSSINNTYYISTLILAYVFKTRDVFNNCFNGDVVSAAVKTVSKFRLLILKKPNNKLDFYAEKLNISTPHLIRIVRKVTGKTPHALISESLLINAKILLKNPNITITEISEELSFSDNSSFGKFFKKHTGFSPHLYRSNPFGNSAASHSC